MSEKRKAVGEIMAALILMLIASITGVLLFTTSLRTSNAQGEILRSQVVDESESSQERFQVINAFFELGSVKIWVHNYGNVEIEIVDVYINGVRTSLYQNGGEVIQTDTLPRKITLTIPDGVTGPTYTITVISTRGIKNVSEWSN